MVDLETTGGSPATDAITEVGAVCYRGGERLGTFGSLVDPRQPIPPYVARLTGISDAMVSGAPPIEHVLPSLLEFLRGAVFVAHNASFDFGFVNANLRRLEYPPLEGPPVCTAKLARRVVWPDVPNVRLQTLARYFRTRVQPSHRALADAEATGEVFAGLLDAGRAPRHPDARRPARGVLRAGPPQLRQDRAGRIAAPLPRRLPLRGPDRSRALRRQGEGPARAREVLLLRRRAQEGAGPARLGRRGPRRAHRTASSRRSRSRRA